MAFLWFICLFIYYFASWLICNLSFGSHLLTFHKVNFLSHLFHNSWFMKLSQWPKEFIVYHSFLTHNQVRHYIAVLGPNAHNQFGPLPKAWQRPPGSPLKTISHFLLTNVFQKTLAAWVIPLPVAVRFRSWDGSVHGWELLCVGFPTERPPLLHQRGDFPGLLYCPSKSKHHSSGLCHDWSEHRMRHSFMYSSGPRHTSAQFTQLRWRRSWTPKKEQRVVGAPRSTSWTVDKTLPVHTNRSPKCGMMFTSLLIWNPPPLPPAISLPPPFPFLSRRASPSLACLRARWITSSMKVPRITSCVRVPPAHGLHSVLGEPHSLARVFHPWCSCKQRIKHFCPVKLELFCFQKQSSLCSFLCVPVMTSGKLRSMSQSSRGCEFLSMTFVYKVEVFLKF